MNAHERAGGREGIKSIFLCDILRPSVSNPNSMLIYDLFATIQNEVKIIRAFIPAERSAVRCL